MAIAPNVLFHSTCTDCDRTPVSKMSPGLQRTPGDSRGREIGTRQRMYTRAFPADRFPMVATVVSKSTRRFTEIPLLAIARTELAVRRGSPVLPFRSLP